MNKKLTTNVFSVFSLALLLFAGCGVEVGNPEKPGTSPIKNVIVTDFTIVTEVIASQLDETLLALTESFAALDETGLGLLNNAKVFNCKPGKGGKVIVTLSDNSENLKQLVRRGQKQILIEGKGKTETIAVFNANTAMLSCNNSKKKLKIDWSEIAVISLEIETFRSKTRQLRDAESQTVLRDIVTKTSGRRFISHEKIPAAFDGNLVKAIINQSITQNSLIKSPLLGDVDMNSTISVLQGEPLEVYEKYTAENRLVDKRIERGTMVSQLKDGAKIEVTYSGVVFAPSHGCQPQAGSISGKIFSNEKDAKPAQTFRIAFGGEGDNATELVFASGESRRVDFDTCPFEEK